MKYEERQSEVQPADGTSKLTEVLLNDSVIATGAGENIKAAKLAAYKQAVLFLQTHCYSIKVSNILNESR